MYAANSIVLGVMDKTAFLQKKAYICLRKSYLAKITFRINRVLIFNDLSTIAISVIDKPQLKILTTFSSCIRLNSALASIFLA